MRITILFVALVSLVYPLAEAASVYVKNGNIVYVNDGITKQLTSSGRDERPVLDPKGEWVYFVRSYEGKWVGQKYYPPQGAIIEDRILREKLWRVKKDGTNSSMLFRAKKGRDVLAGDCGCAIASIWNIQFSPSGDKVYFEAADWTTSNGLHVMDADGSHEKLLGGGNDTRIVLFSGSASGEKHNNYRGYIVTQQHRYRLFGGSYDWYFLFTPDFKEVGPLGDDVAYFTNMGSLKYTDHSEEELKR